MKLEIIHFVFCFDQATESELGDVDLSGLPEAPVDSEEDEEEDEDLERASDALLGRDLVRECLEKDPVDRNDDDIGQSNLCKVVFLVCHKYHIFSKNILCCDVRKPGCSLESKSHLRRTDSCYFCT